MLCTYALIGDKDRALDMLEAAVEYATSEQAYWIPNDADLESLRGDVRYERAIATLRSRLDRPSDEPA